MTAISHPSDNRQPVTLHDVARVAGVSLITASRALSNPQLVSEKTIAKVQDAVASTGYIPNRVAGSLKSRRSHTVAYLVPSISVSQFLPSVQSLTDCLARHGYEAILGQFGYDHAHEVNLVRSMVGRRVDAIVVTGLLQSEQSRRLIRSSGTPLVEIWDFQENPTDMMVGFSHIKVGSAVAGYFLSRGWHRVGVATGDDNRARIRKDGFVSVYGNDVPVATVSAPASLATGRAALSQLLDQMPDIQAVFCSSDQMALGVMTEAQARGIRIPEQLAVCGFGNADFSAHVLPALTTVHVDSLAIGRIAAEMVIARCEGKPCPHPPVVDLGFRIIERDST